MKPEIIQSAKEEITRFKERTKDPKQLTQDFIESIADSPLDLKEKKSKNFSITRKVQMEGTKMTVVSMRNWFMMGYKPADIVLPKDRVVHCLSKKDGGLLMSDTPQEMFLQYPAFEEATGDVLVGGLGLGIYISMILKKQGVTSVTVVEIEQEIIDLIGLKHSKVKVIHGDIKKYLKTTKKHFDFIYIDIHYSTGAMEYLYTVVPLRAIIEKNFPGVPNHFWAEEEMKAQVR